jgi:hypothetical protein
VGRVHLTARGARFADAVARRVLAVDDDAGDAGADDAGAPSQRP